jgi:hypothetical protein
LLDKWDKKNRRKKKQDLSPKMGTEQVAHYSSHTWNWNSVTGAELFTSGFAFIYKLWLILETILLPSCIGNNSQEACILFKFFLISCQILKDSV